MCSREYAHATEVDPTTLWQVLSDVDGWVQWNDGIESIELDGPLAEGASYRMAPPGEDPITSTVVTLEPGRRLTDRTEFAGLIISVEHRLDPHAGAGTTVTFHVEVTGDAPDSVAEEVGAAVSADFPDVIAGLVRAAESRATR